MRLFQRLLHTSLFILLGITMGIGIIFYPTDITLAATTSSVAPTELPVIEVRVHLGTSANELKFVPNQLQFQAGKRYKLVLDNPSSIKHYFTAKDFADSIWSQKVEAGKVEVKGAIHELELKPGAEAEWVFVPIKPGTYELHCSVPGHAEAGMQGILTIVAP